MRKQQFLRPETGISLYEGRTRGKRMKYTYSDDEDEFMTDSTSKRNTRNHTPSEPVGPVVTARGRHIRAPTRLNAETLSNGIDSAPDSVQGDFQRDDTEAGLDSSAGPGGRPRRSAAVNHGMNGWATSKKRKSEEYESDEDEGSEPDFGDDEEEEDHVPDETEDDEEEFEQDEEMEGDSDNGSKPQYVVKLPIKAAVDAEGRAQLVAANAAAASPKQLKSPRSKHRNIIVSDESDSADPPPASPKKKNGAAVQDEPAEKLADVISVAVRRATPEPEARSEPQPPPPVPASVKAPVATPLAPTSGSSASLAFRESPEKPQRAPQPIDVGGGK